MIALGGRDAAADEGGDEMGDFWFNTKTHQVEEGHQSDWTNLLGPYATREEAERALETARARTERWDEEDRRWEEGDRSERGD
jgi:hypothetical protein